MTGLKDSEPKINMDEAEKLVVSSAEQDLVDIAFGGGIAFIGQISTRALSYLYNFGLIWGLGVEPFGLFILGMTIVSFIGIIASLGMPLGVIRFGAMNMSKSGKSGVHSVLIAAVKILIPSSLAFAAATYFGAEWIANIFSKPELSSTIKMLSWGIPFIGFQNLFLAATRSMKKIKYTAIVGIVQPSFALVLAMVLVLSGMGIPGAVYAHNISYIIGAGLGFVYYLRMIPKKERKAERFGIGKMLRFSIPLSITEWVHYANERIEVFFLGMLPGAAAISIYKIAWSLAGLETLLRLSLEQVLAPFSSDLVHRREIEQLGSLYKATARWGFSAALMLFFLFSLVGDELLRIFNINDPIGIPVLLILAGAQLFNEFTGASNTILIMSGRSNLAMMNTLLLLGMNFGLNYWLILQYGLIGAAIAGAASVIIINLLRVLEVWWTMKIHPFKLSFLPPAVIGSGLSIIIYLIQLFFLDGSMWLNLGFGILFCLIYLIVVTNNFLDHEDKYVLGAIKRKLQKPQTP
jgi:O-antigen/teichoic acid export membrane protein